MTYNEIYDRALSKLNLEVEKVSDYRPAVSFYVPELERNTVIPNAIIIWLKDGSRIIYIEPKSEVKDE